MTNTTLKSTTEMTAADIQDLADHLERETDPAYTDVCNQMVDAATDWSKENGFDADQVMDEISIPNLEINDDPNLVSTYAARLKSWSTTQQTLLIKALLENTQSARAVAHAIQMDSDDGKLWLHERIQWPDGI